ncbi:hypothetical protein AWJ20_1749 [Sugiyamaella lignohabitans]|uniref:Protein BIG1 n=1 Tax=Sugiyamaella lignohabitans TaxID=796027 RepID=A0A167DYX7_9ASCO|nr:uncharacterized protein AWJ20_1749 [Sugiyamaella lignohabitans]ANB13458.1 hypothetical protein AWJ20_1749 [Sugiyamaella lignohabitans]
MLPKVLVPTLLASIGTLSGLASAFQNTVPFIVISNTRGPSSTHQSEFSGLETPKSWSLVSVVEGVEGLVKSCSYDTYIVVKQYNAQDSDLSISNMPHLADLANNAKYTKKFESLYSDKNVPYLTQFLVSNYITNTCPVEVVRVDGDTGSVDANIHVDATPRLYELEMPIESYDKDIRAKVVRDTDNIIYSIISTLPSPNFVVIYSGEVQPENLIFSDSSQQNPKISVSVEDVLEESTKTSEVNNSDATKLTVTHASASYTSLFHDYQFFSPGVWMGSLVSVLFLTILYIALSWLSSLQVSYKAFEPAPVSYSEKH